MKMSSKIQKLFFTTFILFSLLVICAPTETESTRVIFYAPRQIRILTSQILSSRAKEKPCPDKCQMRDHRGNCRRIISFSKDGVHC